MTDLDERRLEELSTALEELKVSSEELRLQHQALRDAYFEVEQQRLHFEQLFALSPDAYILTDAYGTILEANVAGEQMLGAAADRLRGKPLAAFIADDDRGMLRNGMTELRARDTSLEFTAMVLSRSGAPLRAALRASRIRDRSAQTRFGWVIRDTTEKYRVHTLGQRFAEEQTARIDAERAARRFRLLAEASRQLTTTTDIDTICQGVAKAVVKYGSDHCEILLVEGHRLRSHARVNREPRQAPFTEALRRRHNMSAESENSLLWRAIRTSEVQASPAISETGTHTQRDLFASVRASGARNALALPLYVPGRTLGVLVVMGTSPEPRFGVEDIGVLIEIATRAALAISNALLFQELEQANQEKADFLEVLSHELRTPLTAVIGYSDLLLSGIPEPLAGRAREHVERIRSCSWHQLSVVEQILKYSRVETGIDLPVISNVNLNVLISEAASMVETTVREKNVSLSLDLPQSAGELNTDAGRLRQIIVNLLTNAFKFTDEGGVSLSVRRDDQNIFITVSDTGIGISQDDVAHVFDPFWRGSDRNSATRVGTGLGLAVSNRLARSLGGDLTVQSQVNVGTVFTLRLPVR